MLYVRHGSLKHGPYRGVITVGHGGRNWKGRDHQIGAKRCVRHAVSPRVLGMHTVIIMRNAALLASDSCAHRTGAPPPRSQGAGPRECRFRGVGGTWEGAGREGGERGCRIRRGQVKVSFTRRGVRCSFSSRCVSHHAFSCVRRLSPHMHTKQHYHSSCKQATAHSNRSTTITRHSLLLKGGRLYVGLR